MDDPTANPTETSQPTHQITENIEEEDINYNPNYNCRFCNVMLYGGIDINNLMHCQNCHNVWDGNAQCNC